LAHKESTFVSLDELAVPFAKHVAEHLSRVDKQGTPSSSRFLDACRKFNRGEIDNGALVEQTVALGFQNVIDAYPVLNRRADSQQPVLSSFQLCSDGEFHLSE
jgi:hypothetical protein